MVSRIEEARARSKMSDYYAVSFSLLMLKSRLEHIPIRESEALGYFPVSVVAHLEVFFKHALRDLLDTGSPFLARANSLIKEGRIRLDSSVAEALAGRRVTFGELIATSLGYSDLQRTGGYLSQLLDEDFLGMVRAEVERSEGGGRFAEAMASLAQLYEVRHIIAHEVRPEIELTHEVVEEWIEAAYTLLDPAAKIVTGAIFPDGIPSTQAEMNEQASEDAREALEGLASSYGLLSASVPGLEKAIEDSHSRWLEWARDAAKLTRDILAESGTAGPTLEALEMEAMARDELARVQELVRRATDA